MQEESETSKHKVAAVAPSLATLLVVIAYAASFPYAVEGTGEVRVVRYSLDLAIFGPILAVGVSAATLIYWRMPQRPVFAAIASWIVISVASSCGFHFATSTTSVNWSSGEVTSSIRF